MAESLYTTQTPDSLDNAEATYVMGTEMVFAVAGLVTGVRWRSATNAISTSPSALLYDSAGNLLASKAAGSLTAGNAWNTVLFDTSYAVSAATYYVVAFGPVSRYSALSGMHSAADVTNGNITAPRHGVSGHVNGRFVASAVVAFPTSGGGAGYFVDVLFEAGGQIAATLPALSASLAGGLTFPGALAATLPALSASLAQTPNVRATSSAAVTEGRTSAATVTAGRTSASTVT